MVMGCERLLVRGNLFDPFFLSFFLLPLHLLPLPSFSSSPFLVPVLSFQRYPSSSCSREHVPAIRAGGRRNKGINLARIRFALEASGRALYQASRDSQVEEPSLGTHRLYFSFLFSPPFPPRIAHFLSVTSTYARFVIISRSFSECDRFVHSPREGRSLVSVTIPLDLMRGEIVWSRGNGILTRIR